MFGEEEKYGVIGYSGEEVRFYLISLVGESIKINLLGKTSQDLPTRHRKGGQSQKRHERNHDIQRHTFLTKSVEKAFEVFFKDSRTVMLAKKFGVIGPSKTKQEFYKHPDITSWFPMVGCFDTEDISGDSVFKIFNDHKDLFAGDVLTTETNKIQEILNLTPDLLLFGEEEIFTTPCKKIWMVKDYPVDGLIILSDKTEIIKLPNVFETYYRCKIVGLKWD